MPATHSLAAPNAGGPTHHSESPIPVHHQPSALYEPTFLTSAQVGLNMLAASAGDLFGAPRSASTIFTGLPAAFAATR